MAWLYIYIFSLGAQAPRNVSLFCCSVIVWKAPSRAYGVITGYHISFSLPGRNESVLVVKKNRDEFFHAVKEQDLKSRNALLTVNYYVAEGGMHG